MSAIHPDHELTSPPPDTGFTRYSMSEKRRRLIEKAQRYSYKRSHFYLPLILILVAVVSALFGYALSVFLVPLVQ